MKKFIKKALASIGIEARRIDRGIEIRCIDRVPHITPAGSTERPIGDVRMFLEDVRARGFNPRGIIDVGANRGNWTRMALSVFPRAKVIMIEPQQEMQKSLKELCSEIHGVEFIQAGAGREKGQLVQTIWDDLAGSSFLPETSEEKLHEGRQRMTPIITIDEVIRNREDFSPDLVKVDLQGFELEALNGAISLFGKTQLFILETSLYQFMPNMPITAECIQFMADHGYEFYDVTEYLRRPPDGALGQIDLAFALRGGDLRRSNQWDAEQLPAAIADKPRV